MSALAEQLQQELLLQKKIKEKEDSISKLDAKIMPNNIHIIHHQIEKDFKKKLDNMIKLQNDGILYGDELKKIKQKLRETEIDIRKRKGWDERNRNGFLVLNENEKFITLTEFLDNINKVDIETKKHFSETSENLIKIQPQECMIYLNTIINIMKKQQKEIEKLKLIINSK